MFYAVLRSLDKISSILEQSYKNSRVVSTESVIVLSINTSIEAVDNLVIQIQGFKSSIVELNKSVASVRKYGLTVGNNHDKLSDEVN